MKTAMWTAPTTALRKAKGALMTTSRNQNTCNARTCRRVATPLRAAASLVAVMAMALGAALTTPCPGATSSTATSCVFDYTGMEQTLTAPTGVTTIFVDAIGGAVGAGLNGGSNGGAGGGGLRGGGGEPGQADARHIYIAGDGGGSGGTNLIPNGGTASVGATAGNGSVTISWVTPATTISVTPSVPNGAHGWYTTTPSVTLSASESGATGALTTYYALDNTSCAAATETTDCQIYRGTAISIPDGTHTLTYFSVAPFGNAETPQTQTIDVDTIAPTVSFTNCPSSVLLNSTASAGWTASDQGSGLASASSGTVTLATGSVGPHSMSAPAATDIAGNTSNAATCAYNVDYQWSGFSQPINDPAAGATTMSVFKAGSTIPVKFELHDANGAIVQAGSLPSFSVSAPQACSSASVDASGTTDTGDTGSTYRWDSTSQQYIYNYHTSSSLSGMCQYIQATLDDGTTQNVMVAFK